jgi:hypothetical protein
MIRYKAKRQFPFSDLSHRGHREHREEGRKAGTAITGITGVCPSHVFWDSVFIGSPQDNVE